MVCLLLYWAGFRFYSRYLADTVYGLADDQATPAHTERDDIDYLPTNRFVLFGHHYASITGLSPMLGPAIAVIWGWVPALLWVVCGALLVGCVHDMSALVLSIRARGLSVGAITEGIIGRRAKTMFHLVIFFGIGLAMGVFVSVISTLFTPAFYPQSIVPSFALILLAVVVGFAVFKGRVPAAPVAGLALLVVLAVVVYSAGPEALAPAWDNPRGWGVLLLVYSFIASVLPVWVLLQPRDFVNSLLLYLGMALMYAGFFVQRPDFVAPAFEPAPAGAPPLLPFVFVVIACGAVSGFHGLVSSGTTAKQLDRATDARMIGYGGMIGESLLGLMAVLACTAGLGSSEQWHFHYADWGSANTLGQKIGVFIEGSAGFVSSLGIPAELATALVAAIVVSFALTTLDSATRLLRYNISEIAAGLGLARENRYLSSALAVGVIAVFAFYRVDGRPVGLALWALFGTTNQLLASLTLMLATVYLYQRGRNFWVTAVPAALITVVTLVAMVVNLASFHAAGQTMLLAIGLVLVALALGIVGTALRALLSGSRGSHGGGLDIFLPQGSPGP